MESNFFKSAAKSGLIVGGLFFINFFLGTFDNFFIGIFTFLVLTATFVVIYFLTIQYRNNECNGYISYGQSFSYILTSYLIGAFIYAIFVFIYCNFINLTLLPKIYDSVVSIYDQIKFPLNDTMTKMLDRITQPLPYAILQMMGKAFVGVFVGLIMSAFIKKEKGIFDK